ncbi:hypothetical protein Nepgr_032380 [Nepenthes gracilis]|uniref:Uncharacterized protein n=1 Tax=Nepenthes gracilis TaxID=150966 RepID=A0AAD3Y5L7_NEPGR|nr:hypothetical protein Nepgr_032380 [Nepenthes gracilis]
MEQVSFARVCVEVGGGAILPSKKIKLSPHEQIMAGNHSATVKHMNLATDLKFSDPKHCLSPIEKANEKSSAAPDDNLLSKNGDATILDESPSFSAGISKLDIDEARISSKTRDSKQKQVVLDSFKVGRFQDNVVVTEETSKSLPVELEKPPHVADSPCTIKVQIRLKAVLRDPKPKSSVQHQSSSIHMLPMPVANVLTDNVASCNYSHSYPKEEQLSADADNQHNLVGRLVLASALVKEP